MEPASLLVVDIETIPDKNHHEADKFPPVPFHQIVAIAFLEAEIQKTGDHESYVLKEIRCGGDASFSEKQLVEGFWAKSFEVRLVTYNGRSFDLPVLKYRAMLHGVAAPWLYKGGDRYSNYSDRFKIDWHCDLMDALTDFGASKAVKLDELSKLFGFPGKFGIDGSQIEEMFEAGKIKKIRDYCETDVLNTYLVYLRFMLHRDDLTKDGYNKAVTDVLSYIDSVKTERPHFSEFVEEWGKSNRNKFLLD